MWVDRGDERGKKGVFECMLSLVCCKLIIYCLVVSTEAWNFSPVNSQLISIYWMAESVLTYCCCVHYSLKSTHCLGFELGYQSMPRNFAVKKVLSLLCNFFDKGVVKNLT